MKKKILVVCGTGIATSTVATQKLKQFLETGRALNLPAEHMLVARVTGGWLNILAQLDCTVRARELAAEWVPGFAD